MNREHAIILGLFAMLAGCITKETTKLIEHQPEQADSDNEPNTPNTKDAYTTAAQADNNSNRTDITHSNNNDAHHTVTERDAGKDATASQDIRDEGENDAATRLDAATHQPTDSQPVPEQKEEPDARAHTPPDMTARADDTPDATAEEDARREEQPDAQNHVAVIAMQPDAAAPNQNTPPQDAALQNPPDARNANEAQANFDAAQDATGINRDAGAEVVIIPVAPTASEEDATRPHPDVNRDSSMATDSSAQSDAQPDAQNAMANENLDAASPPPVIPEPEQERDSMPPIEQEPPEPDAQPEPIPPEEEVPPPAPNPPPTEEEEDDSFVFTTPLHGELMRVVNTAEFLPLQRPTWSRQSVATTRIVNSENAEEQSTYIVLIYTKQRDESLTEWAARSEVGESFPAFEEAFTANGWTAHLYTTDSLGMLPDTHALIPTDEFVYYIKYNDGLSEDSTQAMREMQEIGWYEDAFPQQLRLLIEGMAVR